MSQRKPLQGELLRRGLVNSKTEAIEALSSNRVRVNGAVVANGASLVANSDALHVIDPPNRFVGRGGEKLLGALDHFGIAIADARCIDAGASTGGFTDCLLQKGARHVLAVDVGRAQLHQRILVDPRVTSMESCNIADLQLGDVPDYGNGADVLVADLSFTSLAAHVAVLVSLVAPSGQLVLLVKPQFESDRADVPVGGVVVDPVVHERALVKVEAALLEAGCQLRGRCASSITGTEGNQEFFVWAEKAALYTGDHTVYTGDNAVEQR